jgi:hypothetical protein
MCLWSGGGANAVKIRGNGHSSCYKAQFAFNTGTCVGFRLTEQGELDPFALDPTVETLPAGAVQAFIDIEPNPCNGVFCRSVVPTASNPDGDATSGLFVPEIRDIQVIDEPLVGPTAGPVVDGNLLSQTFTNPSPCNPAALFIWYIGEASEFANLGTGDTATDILRIDDNGGPLIDGPSNLWVHGLGTDLSLWTPGAIVKPVTRLVPAAGAYTAQVARTVQVAGGGGGTVTNSGGTRLRGIMVTLGTQ